MVLISDGCSEICAHVRRNFCYTFCFKAFDKIESRKKGMSKPEKDEKREKGKKGKIGKIGKREKKRKEEGSRGKKREEEEMGKNKGEKWGKGKMRKTLSIQKSNINYNF